MGPAAKTKELSRGPRRKLLVRAAELERWLTVRKYAPIREPAPEGRGKPAEVVSSYELLLDLWREIDTFERDIVFFADEGGVWQFNLNWKRILPPYIRCLAKVAEPRERRAEAMVEEFVDPRQRGEVRRAVASSS